MSPERFQRFIKREFPGAKVGEVPSHLNEYHMLIARITNAADAIRKLAPVGTEIVIEPTAVGTESMVMLRFIGARSIGTDGRLSLLSTREFQIMEMLAAGMINREIADELEISIKTVDTHRGHILKKLQIRNNSELTRFAIREGVILA